MAGEWEYGSEHYVSDLEQVIDSWGFGAPILIGHSMGAHNVLAYAARNSDKLRAMVAIDTPPDYTERAVEFLRTYADKPPRRFESLEDAVTEFQGSAARDAGATGNSGTHRAPYLQAARRRCVDSQDRPAHDDSRAVAVWESLAQIRCPALIVKVIDSPLLIVEVAEKMVAILPRGSSRRYLIPIIT